MFFYKEMLPSKKSYINQITRNRRLSTSSILDMLSKVSEHGVLYSERTGYREQNNTTDKIKLSWLKWPTGSRLSVPPFMVLKKVLWM